MISFTSLMTEVRACKICEAQLPLGARPVIQLHPAARILIAGQAPGRKVHDSGVPFDDASADRLREWLNVSREYLSLACWNSENRVLILLYSDYDLTDFHVSVTTFNFKI